MPPYTNPQRDAQIAELDEMLNGLKTQQTDLVNSYTSRQELNPSQLFTTAVASLVPILVGYAAGGAKGGAVGATAGGALGSNVIGGMMEDQKLQNEKNKQLIQLGQEESRDLRTQRRQLESQAAEATDRAALQEDAQSFTAEQNEIKEKGRSDRAGNKEERAGDSRSRLETKAIQDEFNKIIGQARVQAQAINDIETMLKAPNSVTAGALRPKLARASGDVGNLAQQEQESALPHTLRGRVTEGINWITGSTETPINPSQVEAVKKYIAQKREALKRTVEGAVGELSTRGANLAPSLAGRGELDGILEGLAKPIREQGGIAAKDLPPVQFNGKSYSPDQVGYLLENNLLSPAQKQALKNAGY